VGLTLTPEGENRADIFILCSDLLLSTQTNHFILHRTYVSIIRIKY
jgi:hypothetical protein